VLVQWPQVIPVTFKSSVCMVLPLSKNKNNIHKQDRPCGTEP